MGDVAIRVENLGKRYRIDLRKEKPGSRWQSVAGLVRAPFAYLTRTLAEPSPEEVFWAIKNVSFEVNRGEVVGVVGRNGAGKSTLLKILSRITEPTTGKAEVWGRVGSLLEVGAGFHPDLTGRENIYLNGTLLGLRKIEIDRKFDQIVAFAEIGKFLDTPVKRYSSGMYVRLAFAVAAHLEPDILLVDEVLAVGDYEFQKKCLGKMKTVGAEGRAVIVVSHQLNNISSLCSRCILLDNGSIVMSGDTSQVLGNYVSNMRTVAGERVWDDPITAPGNEKIRLHAVRILSPDGQVSADLDIQEEVVLRVSYWNYEKGNSPKVSIILRGEMDQVVLASINLPSENSTQDLWFDRPFPKGLFVTECRFPPNLLNSMSYSLDLHLATTLHNRPPDVSERDVLSFTVHDLHGRDASGIRWQGSVRPKLGWTTTCVGSA